MSNTTLTNPALRGRLAARLFHRFALAFALAAPLATGCTVIVTDNGGHGPAQDDDEDLWEVCYDNYDECLDVADGEKEQVLQCGDDLESCIGEVDDGSSGGSGGSGGSAGDSAGSADTSGDTAGQDGPSAEICVSLHQSCVAEAQDVEATLACEALFDHCAHPGVCEGECPKACAGLDLCLADYGGCVATATKDYEVEACNLIFDGCVADAGGELCLPADDAQVDECLAEHALCTACAEGDAELAACNDVFDACVHPPV